MRDREALTRPAAVPLMDLGHIHAELKSGILDDVSSLIESGAFVNGPAVAEFEAEFASFCGAAHCVGLSSGLDALRLGLLALDVQSSDEVVLPALTFIATAEAVIQAGARPVLADIGEGDLNIDPEAAKAAVTPHTRALLPVHLYGQMANLRALEAIADRAGEVAIVEDAAQAHGAERDGRRAGTVGSIGAFSFYPAKNLGALGDAGAATTDDPSLAKRLRALREHGQFSRNEHALDGYTARLDTLQALALLRKLPRLNRWNDERRRAAAFYDAHLESLGDLRLPPVSEGSIPVWHLYVVRTAQPDALASHLSERGVASGRHYPHPVHLAPAFANLGYRPGEFPVAEATAEQVLSLPIYPGISEQQLEAVVSAVGSYFD